MFRRLIFDHWVVIFPLISFVVAATVYGFITWRAFRMKRPQVDHLSHLPFSEETDCEEKKISQSKP